MPEPTPPATATTPTDAPGDVDSNRAPRFLSHAEIRDHVHDFAALPALRNQTLVRYDGVWWVADRDGYTEITGTEHNTRLDRWHQRLTHGALWT